VDYSKVVKSNSDKTLWSEFHDVEDLVQTINPQSGWVFNTNNNPAHATAKSEWQSLDDYPAYFGISDNGENNRAERFLELMREDASSQVSFERMKEMKFDYEFPACGAYQNSIENLFHVNPNDYPELAPLITMINEWDKRGNKENKGAGDIASNGQNCDLSPPCNGASDDKEHAGARGDNDNNRGHQVLR